ncbi:MAG: hypothetical protein FVQ85_18400 [Planctomycetes bacterium]|nr:hypothetical protein [Planctomycetota bacterium]
MRRTEFWKETRHFGSWLESEAVANSNEKGEGTILIKLNPDGTAEAIRIGSIKDPDVLNDYKMLWCFLYSLDIRVVKLDARLERNQIEDVMSLLYAYRSKLIKRHNGKISPGPVGHLLSENGLHIACTCTSIQGKTLAISYSYCTLAFSRLVRWFEHRHKNFHDHRALFYTAPRYALVIGVIMIGPGVIYAYMLGNRQLLVISGFMALLLAGIAYVFFMVAGSIEYDNEEKEYQLNKAYNKLKNYAQECEYLAKTLASKNKELQNFTSIIRHDLGNPLMSIDAFSIMLDKYCDQLNQLLEKNSISEKLKDQVSSIVKSDISEAVSYIQTSTAEMRKLLEGLKQVADVGHRTLQIEPQDMNEIVRQIVSKMRFQFDDCGASVAIETLPACLGDATQLNQVFRNLLNNALKYLDPNRKGSIHIYGRVEQGMSIYCVEDNGIGVAPANKEKIFEIFHRVDSQGPVSGEGLGLTIVGRIIERHKGRIRLESELGKGSIFCVALPTA